MFIIADKITWPVPYEGFTYIYKFHKKNFKKKNFPIDKKKLQFESYSKIHRYKILGGTKFIVRIFSKTLHHFKVMVEKLENVTFNPLHKGRKHKRDRDFLEKIIGINPPPIYRNSAFSNLVYHCALFVSKILPYLHSRIS